MNPQRIILTTLCFLLCGHALAQDIDVELSNLTDRLAGKISAKEVKKVAVIDFTDLLGGSSELGKYIAEQMTVDFVMTNHNFSVLDRANLNRILAEHKLTAKGLIDPENAKKLGMFAGVDAIILGTIIPKGENIALTAKIITTETAEIVGADKSLFKKDDTVKQLMSQAVTTATASAGSTEADAAKVVKSFDDLRVELQSLKIVNGKQYSLDVTLVNQSKKKTIYVALSSDNSGTPKGSVTDSDGYEFPSDWSGVSGLAITSLQNGDALYKATEIKPGESISATVKYISRNSRTALTGQCKLQIEFLLSYDFNSGAGHCSPHNLVTKIPAE